MDTKNRFFVPGIIFGIAIGTFILGQILMPSAEGPYDGVMLYFGGGLTLLSIPTCFAGVIILAYALGKPGEKINLAMVVQDISNPAIAKISTIEHYGDPKAQGYGSLMITLGILCGPVAILFWIMAFIYSFDAGSGGFGGAEPDAWETAAYTGIYTCVGGIILFLLGLITVARPWSWSENQQKVAVVQQKVVAIPSIKSSQEDLSSLTVVNLKKKLKEKGLAVSGKKEDLIARLKTGKAAQKVGVKIIHNCSNCKQVLKVPLGYEGRIKCPTCDTISTL